MLHFCTGEPTDDGIRPSRGRGLQKTGMTLSERHMETVRMSQKRKTGDRLREAWEQEGYWIDCITAFVSGDIKEDKDGTTKVY